MDPVSLCLQEYMQNGPLFTELKFYQRAAKAENSKPPPARPDRLLTDEEAEPPCYTLINNQPEQTSTCVAVSIPASLMLVSDASVWEPSETGSHSLVMMAGPG